MEHWARVSIAEATAAGDEQVVVDASCNLALHLVQRRHASYTAVREAAEVVSRVAAVAPDHECVVTVLATALEADGRWDDARQTLQRGLARFEAQGLHAAVPGVLLELGTVAVHGNDLQTAYQLFRCVCGGRGWRCTRWRQRVADVECVSCWVGTGAEK